MHPSSIPYNPVDWSCENTDSVTFLPSLCCAITSLMSNSLYPLDLCPPCSSVHGFSRQEYWMGDLPGRPVVKMPGFHYRAHGFDPWVGNQAPTHHALWPKKKRILEWVAMPFSRGSSQSRVWTSIFYVSCMGRQFFTLVPLGKPVWDNTMSNHSVLLFNTIKGITMRAQTAWTLLVQVIKMPMLGEMNDVLSSPISQLNINLLLTLA